MKSYQVNHLCLHTTYTIIVHSKKKDRGRYDKGGRAYVPYNET